MDAKNASSAKPVANAKPRPAAGNETPAIAAAAARMAKGMTSDQAKLK